MASSLWGWALRFSEDFWVWALHRLSKTFWGYSGVGRCSGTLRCRHVRDFLCIWACLSAPGNLWGSAGFSAPQPSGHALGTPRDFWGMIVGTGIQKKLCLEILCGLVMGASRPIEEKSLVAIIKQPHTEGAEEREKEREESTT